LNKSKISHKIPPVNDHDEIYLKPDMYLIAPQQPFEPSARKREKFHGPPPPLSTRGPASDRVRGARDRNRPQAMLDDVFFNGARRT
jgi:hypothetical protein